MLKNKFIIKKNGYVLLELVISLAMFSLIILIMCMAIFDLSKSVNILISKKNNLNNIRLAESFLREQLRRADKIELSINNNSSMKKIKIYDDRSDKISNPEHEFEFKSAQKTINFGDNKLAENISDVKIIYLSKKKLLGVKILDNKSKALDFVLYLRDKEIDIKIF